MAPILDRHPVRIAVDSNKSEPRFLILADGVLVAVLSHLQETVDGELQNNWYIEAGFGPCEGLSRTRFSRARMMRNAGSWQALRGAKSD
jgi:hypothetical protein